MLRTALLMALAATPALADPEGYGHMMGWGYGNGLWMIFGSLLWFLVLGLVVAGIIWFVRSLDHQSGRKNASNAMAELDLRFARGEIDAEEYASRKKLLAS